MTWPILQTAGVKLHPVRTCNPMKALFRPGCFSWSWSQCVKQWCNSDGFLNHSPSSMSCHQINKSGWPPHQCRQTLLKWFTLWIFFSMESYEGTSFFMLHLWVTWFINLNLTTATACLYVREASRSLPAQETFDENSAMTRPTETLTWLLCDFFWQFKKVSIKTTCGNNGNSSTTPAWLVEAPLWLGSKHFCNTVAASCTTVMAEFPSKVPQVGRRLNFVYAAGFCFMVFCNKVFSHILATLFRNLKLSASLSLKSGLKICSLLQCAQR